MNKNVAFWIIAIIVVGLGFWYFMGPKWGPAMQGSPANPAMTNTAMHMQITSADFANGGLIPAQYTCDGSSTNPQLSFLNVPSNAKSLALIMYDPDVPTKMIPTGMYEHWVVFNIPPTTMGVDASSTLSGTYGANGSGKPMYTGPCPPDREHRYIFDLYALDELLSLKQGASRGDVLAAMQSHILSQAELLGRFNSAANLKKTNN